jgi:hypothetical protein
MNLLIRLSAPKKPNFHLKRLSIPNLIEKAYQTWNILMLRKCGRHSNVKHSETIITYTTKLMYAAC